MNAFADRYSTREADKALKDGKVVIFGAGLGSPFFSTDTAAVLRAAEIGADAVLMAKNIDGVYTADPQIDPNAKKL
jgi:uridylate kinase